MPKKRLRLKSVEYCTCIIPDLLSLRHLEANSCCHSVSPHAVQEYAFPSTKFSSYNERNGSVQELTVKSEATIAHLARLSLLLPEY